MPIVSIETLRKLEQMAKAPNHMHQIGGDYAQDVLNLFEMYRAGLAQATAHKDALTNVGEALALHRSMALSGEQPSTSSELRFSDAMNALDRVNKGIEMTRCCKCRKLHDRGNMKVMESFQRCQNIDPKDWTLMCCSCWQAFLQSELGMLRVHAGCLVKDIKMASPVCNNIAQSVAKLETAMQESKKRRRDIGK